MKIPDYFLLYGLPEANSPHGMFAGTFFRLFRTNRRNKRSIVVDVNVGNVVVRDFERICCAKVVWTVGAKCLKLELGVGVALHFEHSDVFVEVFEGLEIGCNLLSRQLLINVYKKLQVNVLKNFCRCVYLKIKKY